MGGQVELSTPDGVQGGERPGVHEASAGLEGLRPSPARVEPPLEKVALGGWGHGVHGGLGVEASRDLGSGDHVSRWGAL